jgi:hypothetical protein
MRQNFVQSLESRRLLASAALVDGVFQIYGTAGNDKITVGGATGIAVPAAASSIVIHGARGNDVIAIDPSVTLPSKIYGDAGDDTMTGGSGTDRIWAGDGNDVVSAGDAKDTIYAEAGDDYIRGGGGTDLCDGGDGRDTILADAGNDHLYGDANPDNLRGGAGNDDLHGGGGGDALHGEAGDDFLAGDKAADHLFPGTGDNLCDAHDDDFILDGGLTTSGGATVNLTANSNYIVGSAADGASLDLADNTMIIDGQTVVPRVSGLIQSGRNGGSWDGPLGVATGQQVAGGGVIDIDTAVWAGQTVSGSDVLVMYTYGGDANLDGKINVDDYGHIDSSIPTGATGWFNGDFNYDGKINIDDYGIIDPSIFVQQPTP